MSRTTFFTVALGQYELFVLPYIASALTHNEDADVEICLQDSGGFQRANATALGLLAEFFGDDRFRLRGITMSGVPPSSVRFLEVPSVMTEFTYIADIDILILESVSTIHIRRMARQGLPYSNMLRPGRQALSGLHFTRSDAYYPVMTPAHTKLDRAEYLLYDLVAGRGWGTPPHERRPGVHGYHLSPNRSPVSLIVDGRRAPSWGLDRSSSHFLAYRSFMETPIWRALLPHLDSRYLQLLGLLDLGLALHHSEYGLSPGQPVGFLLKSRSLVRNIVETRADSPAR